MGFRSSNIVQQTARCGFADWAVFVGKCHLDRILSVNWTNRIRLKSTDAV
jgi:hypothetical protein